MRSILTVLATAALFVIGVVHVFRGSQFIFDVIISLLGMLVFLKLYDRLHQDEWSYAAFLLLILLHASNLYWVPVPLTTFDHVLHVYGGFALGLIADRMLLQDAWSGSVRAAILILVVMGASALHEIIEFLGYLFLGEGEGFLFYGLGDEGDWFNSMRDLIADFLGVILFIFGKKALKVVTK